MPTLERAAVIAALGMAEQRYNAEETKRRVAFLDLLGLRGRSPASGGFVDAVRALASLAAIPVEVFVRFKKQASQVTHLTRAKRQKPSLPPLRALTEAEMKQLVNGRRLNLDQASRLRRVLTSFDSKYINKHMFFDGLSLMQRTILAPRPALPEELEVELPFCHLTL